ncbi:MAG: fumarylacetoacetate hydrolase family protein [Bdellovibrionaceae bacterium]|nr:fumarylacetoacetate hydrolase family protein [Pseudobdellovibrionaceae bacterium]
MIRNIWCVGRNYRDHAKEMNAAVPSTPMIFLKAGSSASVNSTDIILPFWAEEIHHEVEIALKLSPYLHVVEAAVALDLTERKAQAAAKAKGEPWTLSKSFDGACAVSAFFMVKKFEDLADKKLRLWVNDELKQEGTTADMIFGFAEIVEHVKTYFPICAGDLILTGTPAGVGPLKDGDTVRAEFEGEITHIWKVRQDKKPEDKQTPYQL